MIETNEPRTTEQPAWLELPEKESYWVTKGTMFNLEIQPQSIRYTVLHYSKEDAETSACIKSDNWEWDGEPATQTTLSETMLRVRKSGRKGIQVKQWQDGEFVTVFQYEANQPLPEHLRD